MKEEAETCKKLPPKIIMMGGLVAASTTTTMYQSSPLFAASSSSRTSSTSTPSKQPSDEIFSSLLRMSNFDSISSIKDESLDIDLSACVTISADPAVMGGNSLSSSDFWKVLDESAQTSQLEISGGSNSSVGVGNGNSSRELQQRPTSPASSNSNTLISQEKCELGIVLKKEQNDFSGTFLKPSTGITFSPLKRSIKSSSSEQSLLKEKSPARPIKSDIGLGGGSIGGVGPPSLAPIMRIQQYPKPPIDLVKINGTTICLNSVVIKKEAIPIGNHTTQPPPLAALDSAANKSDAVPKILLEPLYKCLDCDVVFQAAQELTNHTSHRMIFKCMECDREFDVETSLKKHLKTHRPIDARKDAWKKCPDCGKCLKLGSMWMHRKIHTENKKYGCEICGQKFVQKINLTHHQRIHTSEKPYECAECQKRFQERSHLQRHQKYHAQTRSYRCEKCGKMYKTERCLKVHNLVHLEQRPFACTVCDKSFISNSKLKQHSNIHTGERPFKCNYCPRDFTNFPNWLKHTRRRHKVDHKTGEMLENIPSYCSKKSTRTPKEKKTNAEVKTPGNTNTATTNQNSSNSNVKINNGIIDLSRMDTSESVSTSTTATTTIIKPSLFPAVSAPVTMSVATKVTSMAVINTGPPPLAKVPAKRKKKVPSIPINAMIKLEKDTAPQNFIVTSVPQNVSHLSLTTSSCGIGPPPLALVFSTKPMSVVTNLTSHNSTTAPLMSTQQLQSQQLSQQIPIKMEKSKRERKQPMPKQVQQVPPPLIIKKEFIEPKSERIVQQAHESHTTQQTKAPFPDLHCLSITSAEELIMEQALEMEECGLYKGTSSSATNSDMSTYAETDNAVSESVANLHFKIKEEHHDMELKLKTEEYDSLKKNMCSSIESSPFSSPASMEFAASEFNTNSFFLPQFTITQNQIISTNTAITAMKVEDSINTNKHGTGGHIRQLVATSVAGVVPEIIHLTNSHPRQLKGNLATNVSSSNDNPSSFINQLYLPLTVNAGPVLMKSHQALPSVDTLLFSHSKLGGMFNNRNLPKQATTAQHNLS